MLVCGMRSIDLNNYTLKILGTHFSYNKKLKEDKDIYSINLALEGKIVIFKTIAISKIVFQSFITTLPKHVLNELEKCKSFLLGNNCTPKIKYETLCNDFKAGGLKNVNIPSKIIALQCS